MRKLLNFTLHIQGQKEREVAANSGYELQVEPLGMTVEPGVAGLEEAARLQADRLLEAAGRDCAVLIGGHTGLWIRSLEILGERGKARPELAYFETRRIRDSEGRFVFRPEGLTVVPGGRRG